MSYTRISKYYEGCDGTKLAVDLYRPQTEEKVPVLMKAGYSPRRQIEESPIEMHAIERFTEEGYAVAIIEVRGAGASHGCSDGFFTNKDARDMAKLMETMSKEDWCDGTAAMYGGSNHGMIQEITACEQPPQLKAVIPCDCSMDFYYQNFPNGVDAMPNFPANHHQDIPLGTPVDEDPAPYYPLAHQAQTAQQRNKPFLYQHMSNMHRDDFHPNLGYCPNLEIPSWEKMDSVRFGHVHTWSTGAWFDPGCTNKILTFKSWGGKLLLGPWPHVGLYYHGDFLPNGSYDWVEEYIRYYDQVVKGKDNGFLSKPPVYYYTINEEPGEEWKYEADFPVAGTTFPSLFLSADGNLSEKETAEGNIDYRVREDIMIYGPGMRMNRYVTKDMTEMDEKSLVFTSGELPADMEITGISNMELYVTSTHTDGNFIVVLEEVTPDGQSHFITEGFIRASHAAPAFNNVYKSMGLTYHRGFKADDVVMDSRNPLKLVFQLEATSRILKKGSKVRIAISCGGSGFNQPEGFPKEMPVITLYTGEKYPSRVTLPVIRSWATKFSDGNKKLHVFKKAVYLEEAGKFTEYPCKQVYPVSGRGTGTDAADVLCYETEELRVIVTHMEREATAEVYNKNDVLIFSGKALLKERYTFGDVSGEIPVQRAPWGYYPKADRKLYVATVPQAKGDKGNMNPQTSSTIDLFISMRYPEGKEQKNLPCIINIHGYGGNHTQFETTSDRFLQKGYAVASIEYRLSPPNIWPASDWDAKGCIRYLKAHAEELGLNPERFGVMGGSMGGNLTSMIAASNGKRELEGEIGKNNDFDSSVKAAVAYYSFNDFMHFGDDSAEIWPCQPERVAQSDGPYAPLGSLMGFVGPGKGFGIIKKHMYDPDPFYQEMIARAIQASPITHVSEDSAPLCLVHGIYECNIAVPMGQSVRMFQAYSRVNVKSLLLCNTCGPYGEDPEVREAVISFMLARV